MMKMMHASTGPCLALSLLALSLGCGFPPTVEEVGESAAPLTSTLPPHAFEEDSLDHSDVQMSGNPGVQTVAPVSDVSATEWVFRFVSTSEAVPIYSSPNLNLFNTYNNRYLKYESRDAGINLGWSSTQPRNIRFLRARGAGPLRFGDVIALQVVGGGYLKYGSRIWGINLVWSSTPVYEWEVAGGPFGQTVLTNQRVRLINRVERSGMVYCRRPVGVNLAWQNNCTEALGYRILIDYLCSINPIC